MERENFTERALKCIDGAAQSAISRRHEFVTPEHVASLMMQDEGFAKAFGSQDRFDRLGTLMEEYLSTLDTLPEGEEFLPDPSSQFDEMMSILETNFMESSAKKADIPHLANAILSLEDSWAARAIMAAAEGRTGDLMRALIDHYAADGVKVSESAYDTGLDPFPDYEEEEEGWRRYVTCMNDRLEGRNPLIGREDELQKTIRVLCRKEKNNPLHVGEAGVGKTALVWGLARMIEDGNVPERLRGSKVYMMDMTSLLAGTQYRGDFEKRIKDIMDGVEAEAGNNIVYIDEIHMLVGAGASSGDAMDASNMLKPYLESGNIRFIGSTTYEEYNRQFSKSKGLARRFRKIDIEEPSQEEAVNILMQLKPRYEEFHGVEYTEEGLRFAVEGSARHIADRYLPDKAIDLIDEAGASMQIAPEKHPIGVDDIADVLAKICNVDSLAAAKEEDYAQLRNLEERMKGAIYGQDEAIRQVSEAIQMNRAGLLDADKPLASLLFVGPTGVGKTEVARTLASALGAALIRFDMSEYQEKHSVAKLIGAPAGYVGYDDGGLLTDAVRKSPDSVILLDEIEKAHEDIYNILLQVMDYGRLTDNKGRHADFRNVVLIMTSNAGAQHASQASVGFESRVTRGDAMLAQVKRHFKPEFLNRLTATVVFNDMDRQMASLILRKKIGELERKLAARGVSLHLSPEAFDLLLREGFVARYGAREMDRVLRQRLNPLLMREILYGSLRQGGDAKVEVTDGALRLRSPEAPRG